MDKTIVFAHMMKTAGTTVNKSLIGHFGGKMHMIPGGLRMDDDYYEIENFRDDLKKFKDLKLIVGHPIRPYKDYGTLENHLVWATMFREPKKRYLSHYFHCYNESHEFTYPRYKEMQNKSIVEWERIDNCSNYQTKFIAGEENLDKAIEILENKIQWVGLTEELENSLCSFKKFFELKNFAYEIIPTNQSLTNFEERKQVADQYADFIQQQNEMDIQLYEYVKKNIWPKFRVDDTDKCVNKGKSKLHRMINMLEFQIERQKKFKTIKINYKNIKRYYYRWYR